MNHKNNLTTIVLTCPMCGKTHSLTLPIDILIRVENRRENGEYIQDIMKDYSPFDREKLITGYCDDCQEVLFGRKRED